MTARIYNAYRETLVRIANGEEPAKDIAAAVLNLQRLQRGRKVASLQGRRFGRLTVVERVENDGAGKSRWLCVCDCGTQKNVTRNCLIKGGTKSCGCLHVENGRARGLANLKHRGRLHMLSHTPDDPEAA